jgi:hypothetical protein
MRYDRSHWILLVYLKFLSNQNIPLPTIIKIIDIKPRVKPQ